MRIYDKIREKLETTPGLTQRGLAEHMGLDPAAVNRMLYGRRNIVVDEIPAIEDYLGISLSMRSGDYDDAPEKSHRGFSDVPPASLAAQIPVYTFAQNEKKLIDWTDRHPHQTGLSDAFAIYVDDSAMEPRYFPGEIVYLHPGRPLQASRDALIVLKQGGTLLCRVRDIIGDGFIVDVFNPPQQRHISRQDIAVAYCVISRG